MRPCALLPEKTFPTSFGYGSYMASGGRQEDGEPSSSVYNETVSENKHKLYTTTYPKQHYYQLKGVALNCVSIHFLIVCGCVHALLSAGPHVVQQRAVDPRSWSNRQL